MLGVILLTAVNAVVPIVLLILLGYFLRQKGFLNEGFTKIGNKLVFHVFLPVMLFVNVYTIESFSAIAWDVVVFTVGMLFTLFFVGILLANLTTKQRNRKGVVLQCVFRSNFAIIGLSLAGTLAGEQGMAVSAIMTAFGLPVFNILSVLALTIYADGDGKQKQNWKNTVLTILKNPMIIAVVLGFVALGIRELQKAFCGEVVVSLERDMPFFYKPLQQITAMTSPFALVVLGGEFAFSAVKGLFKEISLSTLWRLVFSPLLSIGTAFLLSQFTPLLSCGKAEYAALVSFFGTPVAVSSAVMAYEMGGDEQLATQLVVWTSILSIVTIFLQVCILMAFGLL